MSKNLEKEKNKNGNQAKEEEIKFALPEKCHPYKTKLVIDKDISEEELIDAGEVLRQSAHSSPWWLGDWMVYVRDNRIEFLSDESKLRELYNRYSYGYLRNIMCVCSTFDQSCRHDKLSFSHHHEVASIKDKDEREKWLKKAGEGAGLSVKALRKELAEAKREKENQKLLEDKSRYVVKESTKPYYYEDYVALCERYTNILDNKAWYLLDFSKEYFDNYFAPENGDFLKKMKIFVKSCESVESRLKEIQTLFKEHITEEKKKAKVEQGKSQPNQG